jgi:cation-transporting ATPase I
MPLHRLLGLVSSVARPIVEALRPARQLSVVGDRAHIELRGAHRPGSERATRELEQRLTALDGVRRSEVNAVLGRVVVTHDTERVGSEELLAVVEEVERAFGLGGDETAPAGAKHPGGPDAAVLEVAALAASLVGLGYAVAGKMLPVRRGSPVVPGLLSLADDAPRLRTEVEARLGRQATDALFALGGAATQALAQNPVALLTTACYRAALLREVLARRQAWERCDGELAAQPGAHRCPPVECPPRPVAVPDGPVEYVANRSAALAVAGYAATLAVTRSPDRALGLLLAGSPRAAKVGREAFAAQLDRDFCADSGVVLDPDALRRLDRVDTVVLDAPALLTGRRVVDDVLAIDEHADAAELIARVHDLVDPDRPRPRRERDGWAVLPVAELAAELPAAAGWAAREYAGRGAMVLAVLHGARPVGLATVVTELHPLAEAAVASARAAGSVLVAGTSSRLHRRLDVDGTVPGGNRLPGAVRALQAEGHVVAVVSPRGGAALAAADVGIGVRAPTGSVPWGGHALCAGLAQACMLLDAVPVAHSVSARSARMAVAGSLIGAPLAALGPATGAGSRASFPVHVAALLALAAGTWWGTEPARRPAPVPVERTPWHAMSPQAALDRLGASPAGLAEAESDRRAHRSGESRPEETGLVRATGEELANPLTPVLAAGAGISASVGSVADALLIAGVLGVNALIGGAQRVAADRSLTALTRRSTLRVRVRRDGAVRSAHTDELVPGDVVELNAGDAVPADCRLLEAEGLEVDESGLTGESALVVKSVPATAAQALGDRRSMLYRSTVVAAGRAVGLVVATGPHTEVGRTARLNGDAPPTSGVSGRLRSLARRTLPISIGSGLTLLAADLLRGHPIDQALGRAVGLAVASVPEGLPFVATVAELAAARRLSARGALARNPSTVEALGRVDILCFDKTGTLTEGRIRLRQVSDGRHAHPVEDLTPALRKVLVAAVRASPWDGQVPHQTDRAVLRGARAVGVLGDDGVDHVDELVFEPSRGYHAVRWRDRTADRIAVKGAPEEVLSRCTLVRRDGVARALDAATRQEITGEIDRLARQGYRVLAVAERADATRDELDESDVHDLEFTGLLMLADRVRPTAAGSVDTLQRAGVEIMMITGDHPSTAEAVAAELGVLNGRRVMTGPELDAVDDDELTADLPKVSVFARVSPAQKARIVQALRRSNRVVAVTGDGANDAPAIRLADVGIALGSRATPAAREAADVVVADDRIETITDAIVEGRAMWSSVRDALSILLGGNLGEIAFTVGAGLLTGRQALNTRQLLLVNLLTDVLPAMAVAVRPPPDATADDLLAEGPDASLGSALTRDIYLRAATTAGAGAVGWLLARPLATPGQASTTGLVALVGAQLGQTLAVRGRTPLVVAAGAGSLAALAGVVQVPGVSHFFGCRPLLPHQWAIGLGSAAAATAVAVLWQKLS